MGVLLNSSLSFVCVTLGYCATLGMITAIVWQNYFLKLSEGAVLLQDFKDQFFDS